MNNSSGFKEGDQTIFVTVRQDRRFTKNFVRTIEIKESAVKSGKIEYCGLWFILTTSGDQLRPSIFLNEHKGAFQQCETCNKPDGLKPRVPWGRTECPSCRQLTGQCFKCRANRNDCSC